MNKITLEVSGMSCGHCVKAVEESVGGIDGVNSVKVHLSKGLVDVEYNAETVTIDTMKETIDEQGYVVIQELAHV
jgi:copper chaperone